MNSTGGANIALLTAEIEDLKQIKKEREETIITIKKHSSELQTELTKVTRLLHDLEARGKRVYVYIVCVYVYIYVCIVRTFRV